MFRDQGESFAICCSRSCRSQVTAWNDRSGDSRHWSQPRGKVIGNGNDAPLSGFRLSSRNFYELLLARQMHVLPIERSEFASAKSGKKTDSSGGEQRAAFRICSACGEKLVRLGDSEN